MLALVILPQAVATSVPSLTFNELTDRSEVIVAGRITRSWSDWDSERKFIWTHYELSVSSVHKGAARIAVTVSEPGGVVGGRGMSIAGSVEYSPGDQVAVFLQRMPERLFANCWVGSGQIPRRQNRPSARGWIVTRDRNSGHGSPGQIQRGCRHIAPRARGYQCIRQISGPCIGACHA